MRGKLIASAIVAVTAVTVPGLASGSLSQCPSGNVCLWGNNDFQWLIGNRAGGNGTITNLSGDANNQMDSWANRSSTYSACGYGGANGTGDRQGWSPNNNDSNVAPWNSDEISSWRTRYGC
jgi:hypothetical protein